MERADEFIDYVQKDVDPVLVAPAAMDRIVELTRMLPAVCFNPAMIFECRLTDDSPNVDVLFKTDRTKVGEVLAALEAPTPIGARLRDDPVWARIITFFQRWADPSHPFFHRIRNFWLEHDIDVTRVAPVAPSLVWFSSTLDWLRETGALVVEPDHFAVPHPDAPGDQRDVPRFLAGMIDAAEVLAGTRTSAETVGQVEDMLRKLFRGSLDFAYSVYGSRVRPPGVEIRVDSKSPLTTDVVQYVKSIGWRGSAPYVEELLKRFVGVTILGFPFDVASSGALTDLLRLEFFVPYEAEAREPAMQTVLSVFEDLGVCTPAKAEAVKAWSRTPLAKPPWTPWLLRASSDLKITLGPDGPIEAKAYVGYVHGGFSPAARETA